MEIRLLTPQSLRQYASCDMRMEIDGHTLGDLLLEVQRRHPSLYQCICDETGRPRRHVNLFVENELVMHDHFGDIELRDGNVVSVFQAVSGG